MPEPVPQALTRAVFIDAGRDGARPRIGPALRPVRDRRVLLLAALLALAPPLIGQTPVDTVTFDTAAAGWAPPQTVAGLSITDTHHFPDPAAGIAFRYRGEGPLEPDVYVYPVPEARRGAPADTVLESQLQSFLATLPIQQRRGWFEDFEVAYHDTATVQVAGHTVPGRTAAVTLRWKDEVRVSLFYLFLLDGGRLVKVRATMPEAEWRTTRLAGWVDALITGISTAAPLPENPSG